MNPIDTHLNEWIAASLLGQLTPEQQTEFQNYLSSHPEATKTHQEALAMNRFLKSSISSDQPAPDFEERMVSEFRAARPASPWRDWLREHQLRKQWAPAMALILLLVIVGAGSWSTLGPGPAHVFSETNLSSQSEAERQMSEISWFQLDESGAIDNERLGDDGGAIINGTRLYADQDPPAPTSPIAKQELEKGQFGQGAAEVTEVPQDFSGFAAELDKLNSEAQVATAESRSGEASRKGLGSGAGFGSGVGNFKSEGDEGSKTPGQIAEEARQGTSRLIRRAYADIEVKDYDAAQRDIIILAKTHGGHLATQSERTQPNGGRAGQLVVKVDPAQLETFLLRLPKLGKLVRQRLQTQDVTKDYVDTQARLRNAQRLEERLLELLKNTKGRVSDLLRVEKELARVRGNIESMQGQLKMWDHLVSLATVQLDVIESDYDMAVAYLLKETVNLGILTPEVPEAFAAAKAAAQKAGARVLVAELQEPGSGNSTGRLSFLVAPDQSEALQAQLRALGRIQSSQSTTSRVPENGSASVTPGSERQDEVRINLILSHDTTAQKQISMRVVTPAIEEALDRCRAAALDRDAEILNSGMNRSAQGRAQGNLTVRVAADEAATLERIFSEAGRLLTREVQRRDQQGGKMDASAPVILTLQLQDEEEPRQTGSANLETNEVEQIVDTLREVALTAGIEIRHSSFQRAADGRQQAQLVLRMARGDYDGILQQVHRLGKVTSYTLQRQATPGVSQDTKNSPAELRLTILSPTPLLADEHSPLKAIHDTFTSSIAAIFGSIQAIAVIIAALLPWLIFLSLVGGAGFWFWRRRRLNA